MSEYSDEQVGRLLDRLGAHAERVEHRNQIQARAVYVNDCEEQPGWCVEVGFADGEPELQGWGPDIAAAALACAEEAYLSFALLRGDFIPVAAGLVGEPEQPKASICPNVHPYDAACKRGCGTQCAAIFDKAGALIEAVAAAETPDEQR